ncbi:MAG: LamG domain-containing protein [Saprospirales bacterium]|nr:LamG domain-containing protein [Saprospirales bacterium]
MKRLFFQLIICVFLLSWNTLPGQNNALDFDGDGDYITLSPIAGWTANTDFTIEAWFTADPDGQLCNGNFRRLFALSIPSRFEIGQCGGDLIIFSTDPAIGGPVTIPTPSINILDGNWHCIGVVRSGSLVEIYLDGGVVYSVTSVGTLNSTLFRVGHWHGSPTFGQDWLGRVDEVRLWNIALPTSQLMTCSNCLLTGAEPGLVAYWQLDQGVPSGKQYRGLTRALDASFLGNNSGTLHPFTATPDPGFDLMGSDGNFVTSGTPLVYPNYNNLSTFISDPIQMVGIPWVCNGDATHFSLLDNNFAFIAKCPKQMRPSFNPPQRLCAKETRPPLMFRLRLTCLPPARQTMCISTGNLAWTEAIAGSSWASFTTKRGLLTLRPFIRWAQWIFALKPS